MAFLVYTILRSAASTAGHIRSCSAVSFNRCLMLAICASLSTLLERIATRRPGALAACAFGGAVAADSPDGCEIGGSVVSIAAGAPSAAGSLSGSAVAHPGQAHSSTPLPFSTVRH